jgi:hypothetical protein
MWRLTYPLRYFRLENSEKRKFDYIATMLLAGVLAAPFVLLDGPSFFRPNGFLDKLLTLTSALAGFYVAALVAAATYGHPDLDKTIRVGQIALITKDADGKRVSELLTRREFACMIFGYLAFASLFLSLMCAFFIAMSGANLARFADTPWIGFLFSGVGWMTLRAVVILGLCASAAHIVVATALGLYYLMDRLYRHDRQITTQKKKDEAA